MGLDQYLYRREYLSNYSFGADNEKEKAAFQTIADTLGIEPAEHSPHIHVEVCVAYWRKANAIHKWFCDLDGGRDECQSIYVNYDKLRELRDLCASIIEQPAMAASALPTQGGFFFGSTNYDEWYMDDMKNTVDQLDKVLAAVGPNTWVDFIYRASW
jgi:hypothetical protein